MAEQHNDQGHTSHQGNSSDRGRGGDTGRRSGGGYDRSRGGQGGRGGYRGQGSRDGKGGSRGGRGYRGDRDNRGGRDGQGYRGEGSRGSRDGYRDSRDDRRSADGGRNGKPYGKRSSGTDFHRRDDRDYRGKRDGEREFSGDRANKGAFGGSSASGTAHSESSGDRKPKRDFRHRNTSRDPRRKSPDFKKDGARGGKPGEDARNQGRASDKKFSKPKRHKSKATPARLAALEVVRTVRERSAFAQDVIAKVIDNSKMSVEDRAFATLLALGTVSARGTLDEVIDRALDEPTDVFRETRDALQISTYELLFLGKEPHVAVDQGVEMVKSFSPGPAARVANAVLHKVVRLRLEFPFGNPAEDVEALARTQAFPTWIAVKLIREMGAQAAVDFMRASNEQAPLYVAVNACKADDASVLKAFERAEEQACPMPLGSAETPGCLRVAESRSLLVPAIARQIEQGKMLVSDAASQLVAASVLPDEKPASALEIGAGRATKTILLQSGAKRRYGSQIDEYVTIDNHEYKTNLLRERAEQYGVCVTEALTANALDLDHIVEDRTFDFIFIDAPCSGLGTLRRHPEIRWRLNEKDIPGFTKTQLGMLKAAAGHVNPGGTLAYATCTVTREENAGVVSAFLSSEEGSAFTIVPIDGRNCISTRLAPGASDAHFAVKFVRQA